jgi:glycosyltransferase involved in cell wall biosynthesis
MLRGNAVIAGSKFIFDHIKKNYNSFKELFVVPRGIDITYFDPKNPNIEESNKVRNRWNVSVKNFLILLPGRLTSWKGQMFFLKTFLLLKEENLLQNINAVILGDEQGRIQYKESLLKFIKIISTVKSGN